MLFLDGPPTTRPEPWTAGGRCKVRFPVAQLPASINVTITQLISSPPATHGLLPSRASLTTRVIGRGIRHGLNPLFGRETVERVENAPMAAAATATSITAQVAATQIRQESGGSLGVPGGGVDCCFADWPTRFQWLLGFASTVSAATATPEAPFPPQR